jgi:hypothetical protein
MIEEQANIYPEDEIIQNVERLFELIGAKGLIQGSNALQRIQAINDFLIYVFIRNEQLPQEAPIGFVFAIYANNLATGKVERKGNNVSAMAQAMRQMTAQIRSEWSQEQPDDTKMLAAHVDGRTFEQMGDFEIKRLYETLMMLEGQQSEIKMKAQQQDQPKKIGDMIGSRSFFSGTSPDSSFNRIKKEYKRRFQG